MHGVRAIGPAEINLSILLRLESSRGIRYVLRLVVGLLGPQGSVVAIDAPEAIVVAGEAGTNLSGTPGQLGAGVVVVQIGVLVVVVLLLGV